MGQESDPHLFMFKTQEGAQRYIDRKVKQGWYKPGELKAKRQTGKFLETECDVDLGTLNRNLISDIDPDKR